MGCMDHEVLEDLLNDFKPYPGDLWLLPDGHCSRWESHHAHAWPAPISVTVSRGIVVINGSESASVGIQRDFVWQHCNGTPLPEDA